MGPTPSVASVLHAAPFSRSTSSARELGASPRGLYWLAGGLWIGGAFALAISILNFLGFTHGGDLFVGFWLALALCGAAAGTLFFAMARTWRQIPDLLEKGESVRATCTGRIVGRKSLPHFLVLAATDRRLVGARPTVGPVKIALSMPYSTLQYIASHDAGELSASGNGEIAALKGVLPTQVAEMLEAVPNAAQPEPESPREGRLEDGL